MCGIVGYIGSKQAVPILLDGLAKLEYRGYDSAGVAVISDGELEISKKKGRLSVLEEYLQVNPIEGTAGIGHTRWATHGEPSDVNSHPHFNGDKTIAVVHNGIIENYAKIKLSLEKKGYVFRSQTDTEVLPHLIDSYYEGDLVEAVRQALSEVEGSYAICVVATDQPDTIIAARKDSPLVLGIGNGENYIASDIPAILQYTRDIYLLDEKEMAVITRDEIKMMDLYGNDVHKDIFHVQWDVAAAEKGGYAHFMIKEIHEEPKALRDTLSPRLVDGKSVDISDLNIDPEIMKSIHRVFVVACGTAYHAGVVAKYDWERVLRLPVEVDIASEFRYRAPVIGEGDLLIVISQSGETADTLASLRLGKEGGAKVLAITNVVGSTVSREADYVMYTWAGPEIAVASTKAHTTQVLCLFIIMLEMGKLRGTISPEESELYVKALMKIPEQAAELLEGQEKNIAHAAHVNCDVSDAYFLGRGLDFAVALEGSLKLKEISYIHSEAFAAGELKHGPIALIEENTLVIAVCSQEALYEKMASNIKEVKARGAKILAIAPDNAQIIKELADEYITIPETLPIFMPILSVIPTQLFAYYCSVERGYDVDKPRNLAKSVTVE